MAEEKLYKAEYVGSGTFIISKPKRKKLKARQSRLKNPQRGARKWRKREAGRPFTRPIEVIVVPRDAGMSTIYGLALGALILLRERSPLLGGDRGA